MRKGLSLCAFGTNLPDAAVLEWARERGFEHADLNAYSSRELVDEEGRLHLAAAAALYARTGIVVHSIHGPCVDLSSPDPEERKQGVEVSLAAARAVAELGGALLIMHPAWPRDPQVPASVRLDGSVDSLARLAGGCAPLGVRLAVENLLPSEAFSGSADMLEILRRVPGAAGLCFDSCHASLTEEGLEAMIRALASRVIATHLSDSFLRDDDHHPPGLGLQPLPMVIRTLQGTGYQGVYNFELDAISPKRLVSAVASWVEAHVDAGA